MKKEIRKTIIIMITIFVLSALMIFIHIKPATATNSIYTEDFTTTTYMDASNTNVSGWGAPSGTITLPHKGPYITGYYNMPQLAFDVFISGDYAYLADWISGLLVMDISDPTHPTYVSWCDTPGNARGIYVYGNYAYIADGTTGLQVIDITDPTNPILVGSCDTPDYAWGVFISGDYAYIADDRSGLQVINIIDPTNPIIVGSYNTPFHALRVFVSGDYAYIADDDSFQIIDITDPTNPTFVGSYNYPSWAYDVFVSGHYAYIADWIIGLIVIDISDPTNPTPIGICDTPNYARGVFVSGNYAYIAGSNSGFQVIDITDPTNPILAGSCLTHDSAYDLFVSGDYAYVAAEEYFDVIKIADPVNPIPVGSCNTPGYANDVFVSGDYAYIADGEYGLQVINITDPASPTLAGSWDTLDVAIGVFVSGNYAFLAESSLGVRIINITDPKNPNPVGSCDTPDQAYAVFVSGDYAYVADFASGLQVINIADLTNPILVGSCDTPGTANEVFISGDYAYVADGMSGLQVINITNPTNPTPADSCDTPGYANGVYVFGDYAYVTDFASGLQVINIADLTNPILVGSCDTPGTANEVFISGDYAYVADGMSGLQVINITNPTNPTLEGSSDTSGDFLSVFVSGDYAYIADRASGLQVIEVMWNRVRQYKSLAVAQSLEVFSDNSMSLIKATLTSIDSHPLETSITYYVSPDNGSHWEQVISGLEYYFVNIGHHLKWKAVLNTSHPLRTPTISSLSISFNYVLNAPSLLLPKNGTLTNNNNPTFEWENVSGAINYFLQLDTTTSFNSPNLINAIVFSTSYIPISALSDGVWYWRVAANSSQGELGLFSNIQSVEIDATPPSTPDLISPPNETTINNNTPTFHWSEISDANNYTIELDISDGFSSPYLIQVSGINSTFHTFFTPLFDSTWYWKVCAYDRAGNQGLYSVPYVLTVDYTPSGIPEFIIVEMQEQSFSQEEFNITYYIHNMTGHGIESASIQIWWNGMDVSSDVQNLGKGFYFVSLDPITVAPDEDPILLNMTVSAYGYEDIYFETHIAVDPDTLDKDGGKPAEEFPLTIIAIISTAAGIGATIITIGILRKKRRTSEGI